MIPFPFNENRFSFFVADHLRVGQSCKNPKSDRSPPSCLKLTQCSTSEIGDASLYNSRSLPIQVMTIGPLPAPSKCRSGLPRITGTFPGWWKSLRLRLWSLMWFQVRATSCHLRRRIESQHQSLPGRAEECGDPLVQSPPSAEYSPSSCRRLWKRHAPKSGSESRRWLRLKAATLNRCQLYYIIKLPELIFSIKLKK